MEVPLYNFGLSECSRVNWYAIDSIFGEVTQL